MQSLGEMENIADLKIIKGLLGMEFGARNTSHFVFAESSRFPPTIPLTPPLSSQ